MPSAFDPTTTPGKMTTQVGVVSALISGTRVPLGVTKGGADFNPETKTRAAEYDGRRHIAVGTDEIIEHGPSKMTFTVVEFSDKVLSYLMPGGTTSGDTTTPLDAGVAITAGMMLEAPWHELTLKDGTIIRHEFDFGLVVSPPTLNTKDKDEASMQVTIESRVDPTQPGYTSDMADYRRVVTAP
jgi:hypothetical protein